jgi:hypothetical protein
LHPKARGLADDQVYSLFTMSDITQGATRPGELFDPAAQRSRYRMSRPARTSRETKMRKT